MAATAGVPLNPVAERSSVPKSTAPVASVFTVLADINVPFAFVKLLTVTPCEIVDQFVTIEALTATSASPIIESPISNCTPPPPVPPLP